MKEVMVRIDGDTEIIHQRELRGVRAHILLMHSAATLAKSLLRRSEKLPIEWAVLLNQTADILRKSVENKEYRGRRIGTYTDTPTILKV